MFTTWYCCCAAESHCMSAQVKLDALPVHHGRWALCTRHMCWRTDCRSRGCSRGCRPTGCTCGHTGILCNCHSRSGRPWLVFKQKRRHVKMQTPTDPNEDKRTRYSRERASVLRNDSVIFSGTAVGHQYRLSLPIFILQIVRLVPALEVSSNKTFSTSGKREKEKKWTLRYSKMCYKTFIGVW